MAFPRARYGNSSSGGLASAALAGYQAGEQSKSKYLDYISRQREYELRKDNHDFNKASHLLNLISQKFPEGDSKADQQYELYKQTDQYRELSNQIKQGLPHAVEKGEILRIPQYQAKKNQVEFEKRALEERVTSGTATPEDQRKYAILKQGSDLYKMAEHIASTGNNSNLFDKASPYQQTQMINDAFSTLIRSKIDSLTNQGQVPLETQDQIQPTGFFGNVGKGLDNFFGGNKRSEALAPSQVEQSEVSQGVLPVVRNRQQPNPLAMAQQILSQRNRK